MLKLPPTMWNVSCSLNKWSCWLLSLEQVAYVGHVFQFLSNCTCYSRRLFLDPHPNHVCYVRLKYNMGVLKLLVVEIRASVSISWIVNWNPGSRVHSLCTTISPQSCWLLNLERVAYLRHVFPTLSNNCTCYIFFVIVFGSTPLITYV